MSPFHFQRLFKEWAGVSPKKFLQYISIEHAKRLLDNKVSLSETSFETGLSGTSRLHDLFISIEGMTPGEFKNEGKDLKIEWYNYTSTFGDLIVASTSRGVCYIAFTEAGESGFEELRLKFQNADFQKSQHSFHLDALSVFMDNPLQHLQIKLHLKGTAFQLKVWEALLKIPYAGLTSYSGLSDSIGSVGAARAVGSAVGANPVAYIIPCHRVIRSTGIIGEYHWGSSRKAAMIGRESSRVYGEV